MITEARKRNSHERITYRVMGLEEYDYPDQAYDCVISNLVLHYVEDLDAIYQKVYRTLKPGGVFLFNIEHPSFTAGVNEEWIYGNDGAPQFWPIDRYFYPGARTTNFLGHTIMKYHHTLSQILMGLLHTGFTLTNAEEAQPPAWMMDVPGMEDEMRRPMMLLVRAVK